MFLVIEGIEGSGKSTLQAQLAIQLRHRKSVVTTTREPGGTPLGEDIRALFLRPGARIDALPEALLVNAARAAHITSVIRPALLRSEIVLCDRFTDSTIAYQGYGRGLDLRLLATLCELATEGLAPDLTILLDCDPALSRERLGLRGAEVDRLEGEGEAFHSRVRDGFLILARASKRHVILDARERPELLAEQALTAIDSLRAHA